MRNAGVTRTMMRAALALAAAVAMPVLTGCGPRPSNESPPRGRSAAEAEPGDGVVRIGYSSLTPLHCALGETMARTGVLARHGLKGDLQALLHGKDQDRACAAGTVDATFSCEVPAMIHLDRHPRFVIAGSPGRLGDIALVVRTNSAVRAIADLAGRRILVCGGASADALLDQWMERAGLRRADARVDPVPGEGDGVVQALMDGSADAGVLWDPWLTHFMLRGGISIVRSEPFWSVVFVDREALARSGGTSAYLQALGDAAVRVAQQPDEAVAWTSERSGLAPGVVRAVLEKAGTPLPGLALPVELLERLRACEAYALRTRQVSGTFRLDGHLPGDGRP